MKLIIRERLRAVVLELLPADLLGRLGRIVAQIPAPFIAGIGTACLEQAPTDAEPAVQEAWAARGDPLSIERKLIRGGGG